MGTGFPKRSCSNKQIERDDDSKKSHPALVNPWRGGRSEFTVYSVPGSPFGRAVLATLGEKAASYRLLPVVPGTLRSPASSSPSSLSGDPSLWRAGATSIVGKDFLPAIALEEPVVGQGHGRFCKLRDDAIVPLICPTCQNVFAGFAQSIHASDHHATLHGVVFDILVGSESRVDLAARLASVAAFPRFASEGGAVAQGAGLTSEHGHVMPGVEHRIAASPVSASSAARARCCSR